MTATSVPHTAEELSLLLTYLSLIGIWFAIPSVSLLLNKDDRYPVACLLLAVIVALLFAAYVKQWRPLFPKSAALFTPETYINDVSGVKRDLREDVEESPL